jgi:hypothetical protein
MAMLPEVFLQHLLANVTKMARRPTLSEKEIMSQVLFSNHKTPWNKEHEKKVDVRCLS